LGIPLGANVRLGQNYNCKKAFWTGPCLNVVLDIEIMNRKRKKLSGANPLKPFWFTEAQKCSKNVILKHFCLFRLLTYATATPCIGLLLV
jgi:hypothetical protein